MDSGRLAAATLFAVRATVDGPGGTQSVRSAGIGDTIYVKTHLDLSQMDFSGLDSVKVFLVETAGYQDADSAFASFSASSTSLLLTDGQLLDSIVVEEGAFEIASMLNNLRLKPIAHVVDKAGNLSANTVDATDPEPFAMDLLTVVDSKKPVVTPLHPVQEGDRFTGRTDTTLRIREENGTIDNTKSFLLNPLKLKVDEGSQQIIIVAGADSAVYDGSNSTDTLAFATTDSFSVAVNEQGGVSLDMDYVVFDSVGNEGTAAVEGAIADQVAPVIGDFFPTSDALPDTTITDETRHPKFKLAEGVDSVSVRYIEESAVPKDVLLESAADPESFGVDEEITISLSDSLMDGLAYTLQVLARDRAGNVNITDIDRLKYDAQFENPTGDSFVVVIDTSLITVDSVIAGVNLPLTVIAIDTALSNAAGQLRAAVTYKEPQVEARVEADGQDLSGVVFSGAEVEDLGDGTADVVKEGWFAGRRTLFVKSTRVLHSFSVVVDELASESGQVKVTGRSDTLTVDAAEFSSYTVVAYEDGVETDAVSGAFDVMVMPADAFGNPSDKVFVAAQDVSDADSLVASTNLLDSRIPDGNRMGEIFVELSANVGGVRLPAGGLAVHLAGDVFGVTAPDAEGQGLVISARTDNAPGDTLGSAGSHTVAVGRTGPLSFVPFGETPAPVAPPAAPAALIVHDYLGPDGSGDQGGYVVASFPRSEDERRLIRYRLYREIDVLTGVDDQGDLIELEESVKAFVPWAVVEPIPPGDDEHQVIVAAIDDVETRWAVAGESLGPPTATAVTKAGVDSFLGWAYGVELTDAEVDGSEMVGEVAELQIVPWQSAQKMAIQSTERRVSLPARAVDNIAPRPTRDMKATLDEGRVVLTWASSPDEGPVGHVAYGGRAIAILGVDHYEILSGPDPDDLESVGTVDVGETSFADRYAPASRVLYYRVDTLDRDNRAPGHARRVRISGPSAYLDAEGVDVHLVASPSATTLTQDFEDFVAFAASFDVSPEGEDYSIRADLNGDGWVTFADLVTFAQGYGRTAISANGEPVGGNVVGSVNPTSGVVGEVRVVYGGD